MFMTLSTMGKVWCWRYDIKKKAWYLPLQSSQRKGETGK